MASHLAGIGATVSGKSYSFPEEPASKERWVYGILAQLEREENVLSRLTTDRTDRITITANLSDKTANVDLLLNAVAANAPDGATTYTVVHYLAGSTFTAGT